MIIEYLGFWVMIALAVNMWALLSVLSAGVPWLHRALWLAILLVPVVGFVFWYMLGPRRRAT
ncbi:MAG: hypothetical protein OIF48_01650 [Silicimonas sp.]|nr:hypothetical protein [Silicimonas sp.]